MLGDGTGTGTLSAGSRANVYLGGNYANTNANTNDETKAEFAAQVVVIGTGGNFTLI